MKIKLLESYLKAPLCIYDGAEPKEIPYSFVIDDSGIKLDLWSTANNYWDNPLPTDELMVLNDLLNFPCKYSMKQREFVSHVEDGPIYFGKLSDSHLKKEIFVYFSLFEKQPSRYQCYVLAVLASEA
jgi:hypothetical protein